MWGEKSFLGPAETASISNWDSKSFLGPAEIASISNWDLSRSNKHDTFWHVALIGYF